MNESNTFWRKEYKYSNMNKKEYNKTMNEWYENWFLLEEAETRRDVVLSAWKNYCRESWLYRVLEFIGLR